MADKQYSISVILKAVDKMTKISTRMKTMSAGINRFTNRAFLMTGLATGALTAFVMKTASAGDTLAKTASILDMSSAQLYRYQFAARRSGLSTEELNKSLMFFTSNIGEAVQGTGEAQRAFDLLGIRLRDNEGSVRKNSDLFKEVADRIAAMGDQNLRLSALQLLFGRSGRRMFNVLKDGSKGLVEYEKRLKAIGGDLEGVEMKRFEDFKDMVEDIETSISSVSFTLVSELAPSITRFMDKLALKIGSNRDVIIKTIGGIIDKFKAFISGVWEGLEGIIKFADGFLSAISPARKETDKATDSAEKFHKAGKLLVGIFAGLKALSVVALIGGIAGSILALTAVVLANPLLMGVVGVAMLAMGLLFGDLIKDINELGLGWEYAAKRIKLSAIKIVDTIKWVNWARHYYSPEQAAMRALGIMKPLEEYVPGSETIRGMKLEREIRRMETEARERKEGGEAKVIVEFKDPGKLIKAISTRYTGLDFDVVDQGLLGAGG
jgi:hypothetical protein